MKKKILAFLLSAVITLSAFCFPVAASASQQFIAPHGMSDEEVREMPDYLKLVRIIRAYKNMMYNATGFAMYEVKIFDFTVDDTIQGINDSLKEQSGLDFSVIYENLPDTADKAELLGKIFRYDRIALQDKLNKRAAELKVNGESLKSAMVRFFSVWLGVIEHVDAICEPVEGNPDLVRLTAHIIYKDGRTDKLTSDIYYNTKTQCFEGPDGKTALLGYDLNVGTATLTVGLDGLHRFFGFSFWYDILAKQTSVFMDYNTERIKFSSGDKDYLIQLWKGRYIVTNGGEVGVYTKPRGKLTSFYDCAEDDKLDISLKVTHGDEVFVDLPVENTWWRAAFKMSNKTYDFKTFHYVATIKAKDVDMLQKMTVSLENNRNLDYSIDGMTVTIIWD